MSSMTQIRPFHDIKSDTVPPNNSTKSGSLVIRT